jgi:hypothetical protein
MVFEATAEGRRSLSGCERLSVGFLEDALDEEEVEVRAGLMRGRTASEVDLVSLIGGG